MDEGNKCEDAAETPPERDAPLLPAAAPVKADPSPAAADPADAHKLRWLFPNNKVQPWWFRHRNSLRLLEWGAAALFFLIALYYLWLLLFSAAPADIGIAVRPPSREEFRERLRALAPIQADPVWKVAAKPGRWRGIVIHHTATDGGSLESIDREHREQRKWPNGFGYHFLIGNGNGMTNGEVVMGRRWLDQEKLDGAHLKMSDAAKTEIFGMPPDSQANSFTIGISLVGNFEKQLATPEQLAALKGLIAFLRQEYGIGLAAIVGHGKVSHDPTACPGNWFFVEEVILALANP